jgi:trk system potassium uptake protein TrkH
LVVLDTPVAFSGVGHGIIFALFQVGGIGMMVLSAFATVALGQRLGLKAESALAQQFETRNVHDVRDLTLFIVVVTVLIEVAGAAALYPSFAERGLEPLEASWSALFHSVSAFCNAGFSLQSDSLIGFQKEPLPLGVFAALITLGGIGFAVLGEAWRRLRTRRRRRMPIQVRVVLWMSLLLVVLGSLLYGAVEWDASLAGLSTADKCINSVFQSVTLRTAGFNSVDYGGLHMATLLVMIVFMLIGASPGGTGGGIKTSTVAVLLSVIPALGRGDANVSLFGRSVPRDVIHRAGAIVTVTLLIFVSGCFALALTQEIPFDALVFEAASAVATVGLSVGATSELDELGKVIVTVLMFTGRVGPLTFALALGGGTPSRVRLPEESVAVG